MTTRKFRDTINEHEAHLILNRPHIALAVLAQTQNIQVDF